MTKQRMMIMTMTPVPLSKPIGLLCADLHMSPKERLGTIRAEYKWHRFEWLIQQAISKQVEYFIILGDLFDYPNPPDFLRDKFYSLIEKLWEAGIEVIFISGNHDSSFNSPCFAGDKRFKHKLFLVVTGTEIVRYRDFVLLPWYASLNRNWYSEYANSTILGHVELLGADNNAYHKSETGTPISYLVDNKIRVITGHFHKAQSHSNYEYLGAFFRHNFGEASNLACYGLLDAKNILRREENEDWHFATIDIVDDEFPKKLLEVIDIPSAVKLNFHYSPDKRVKKFMKSMRAVGPDLYKKLGDYGLTNVKYLTRNVITEKETMIVTPQFVEENVLAGLYQYAQQSEFSELHMKLFRKWTGYKNVT